MKSFLQLTEEQNKKLAMLFGRMNPPTGGTTKKEDGTVEYRGHEENVEGLKKMAAKQGADHLVIASHSQDAKKNPLSPDVKLKHLKRAFPNTNITTSSKEKPTILHHAAEAHKKGYTHITIVAGGDRVQEYKKLLHHYNGKEGRHGFYNFKKIEVKSTGERKEGISGTDMRNHAQNNDFSSFHKNLSSHMQKNPGHAKELFKDVRKGMGLTESKEHGMFKAIFVSGGPGSGKDIIIREAIAEANAVEINATLAASILADKHKLSEQSRDIRREAVRNRQPLIINGTTAEQENILYIKEELEELGYETMMIFVNTTDDASKKRNEGHERMMAESIRRERWEATQKISESFNNSFTKYLEFDNSLDLNEADVFEIAQKEEDISIIYEMANWFFDMEVANEIAESWKYDHEMGDYDKLIEQIFNRTQNTPMTDYGKKNREATVQKEIQNLRKKKQQQNAEIQRSIETLRNRMRFEEKENVQDTSKTIHAEAADCTCGDKTTSVGRTNQKGGTYKRLRLLDNICPACQLTAKAGRPDSVTDGDIASNTKYTFRTYHEGSEPTIEVKPEPKEARFQQDNDKIKAKKQKTSPAQAGKVMKPAGVSPEYDTRGSGTVYPMSGLGMVTYREQTENKYGSTAEVTRKSFTKFRKESIDSPSPEMGVTGGYHGPTNKEPPESMLDKTVNQVSNKKKKK